MIMGGSPSFQERLSRFFQDAHQLKIVDSGREGLIQLQVFKPPMVLLGAHLPDMDGLEILKHIQQELPRSKTILFSTLQDMNTTIQAMKLGAFDCVLEDIDLKDLDYKIKKALRILNLNEKISNSFYDKVIINYIN